MITDASTHIYSRPLESRATSSDVKMQENETSYSARLVNTDFETTPKTDKLSSWTIEGFGKSAVTLIVLPVLSFSFHTFKNILIPRVSSFGVYTLFNITALLHTFETVKSTFSLSTKHIFALENKRADELGKCAGALATSLLALKLFSADRTSSILLWVINASLIAHLLKEGKKKKNVKQTLTQEN
ncbi:MAG: hypothetical protein S4CHLAM6_13740 [Chlamydiae bacterium]|nr:hypothetical protein [Chlamydiota bacterium]